MEKLLNLFKTAGNIIYPGVIRKMSVKGQVITYAFIALLTAALLAVVYNFFMDVVMQYKWEIIGGSVMAFLGYHFTTTDAFKSLVHWIFIKYKNWKIFALMAVFSAVQFFYNPEGIMGRAVDVAYIYLMVVLYVYLFSEHKVLKYLKHLIAIGVFVFLRALFHDFVSETVIQLLNFVVLALGVVMILVFTYEMITARGEKKRFYKITLYSLMYATLVFSPYIVSPMIAEKRMSTITFEELDTKPATYNEHPFDTTLADIWVASQLPEDHSISGTDQVLVNGKLVFTTDYYPALYVFDMKVPFMQKHTTGVKVMDASDWSHNVDSINNVAIYGEGLSLGHNTHTAVSKRFNLLEYFVDSTENTIKFVDQNGSTFSAELISTLSDYLTPYLVPKGLYIIPDKDKGFDFLRGAGDYVSIQESVKKYPFLKDQPIVSLNTVKQIAQSVAFVNGYGSGLAKTKIMVPDRDKYGNIIIETLYTSVDGKSGPFAKVEFKARKVENFIKNDDGSKKRIIKEGQSVLETWYIPLFYTGSDELVVYKYDNGKYGDTHYAKSRLESTFLDEKFAIGYSLYGRNTVTRDNHDYILVSRVKVDDNGVHSKNANFALYSCATTTVYPVKDRAEMEAVIQNELASLKK